MKPIEHDEMHHSDRMAWLRAAVLGANDGVLSTSSLVVGVAASGAPLHTILLTGLAGLVAGAMSMAAGEYVSVSSQGDAEKADLDIEKNEIETNPETETEELAQIYVGRGLTATLARQVSAELMKHDALGSHARDELGITETFLAKPLQAAFASAISFTVGAAFPIAVVIFAPKTNLAITVSIASLVFLVALGTFSAKAGGAVLWKAVVRVAFWGAAAMAMTALIGHLFGARLS